MKKRKYQILSLLLITTLLLTSCGGREKEAPVNGRDVVSDYNMETDDQPFWDYGKTAAATKYGYYFMLSEKLFLYDAKTKKLVPLCGRADCDHKTNVDCNAEFLGFGEYMGYYDGSLYTVIMDEESRVLALYQVAMDGSRRTKICELGLVDNGMGGITTMAAVHRGYFYYSIDVTEPVAANRTSVAYRVSLTDGNHAKEEIYRREGMGASIFGFRAYGNRILFDSSALKESRDSVSGYDEDDAKAIYYDIVENKVVEVILEGENSYTLYASGDNIYYRQDQKLFCLSVKDGTRTEIDTDIFVGDESSSISYDFSNLYCLNDVTGTISVYDTEQFEKRKEITTEDGVRVIFGDDKFMFAEDVEQYCLKVYDKEKDGPWEDVSYREWMNLGPESPEGMDVE